MNLPFLKSEPGDDTIIMEVPFSVPVARLYKAWVTPEEIKRWFGAGKGGPETAIVDLREGGAWEFTFASSEGITQRLSGRYTRVEENRLLQFTWVHTRIDEQGGEEHSAESLVTVEFNALEQGSSARLEHKGIAAEGSRQNVGSGWSQSFTKIKTLVE